MDDIGEKLVSLGDPSGRQDADYWDSWFKIVCLERDHRPYEWYCEPTQILRIVRAHLRVAQCSDYPKKTRIIHPGSGTSLVPLVLHEKLDDVDQVVVDVSETAVDEMRHVHGKDLPASTRTDMSTSGGSISYVVADVLKPPMPFESSSFHCWIDKGFLDAVFSKEVMPDKNHVQSAALFQEAKRILVPTDGFMLIVSLAEDHSMQIILDNFLLSAGWKPTFHVWEMEPSSGSMRPFGFVLCRTGAHDAENQTVHVSLEIVWHYFPSGSNGDSDPAVYNVTANHLRKQLDDLISQSRRVFQMNHFSHQGVNEPERRLVSIVLDIKPADTDTDLVSLSTRIRSTTKHWIGDRQVSIVWRPIDQNRQSSNEVDTGYHMIIPIGFGLHKLQLCCVVSSEDADDLPEVIESSERDSIQSVDIDWTQSSPVSYSRELLARH